VCVATETSYSGAFVMPGSSTRMDDIVVPLYGSQKSDVRASGPATPFEELD
jgi:hypothetical protein